MKMKRSYKTKRHYTELGIYLQAKRVEAGITQRELADQLQYSSAQFISNFERGLSAPPLPRLKLISRTCKLHLGKVTKLMLAGEEKKIIEALYN